MKISLAAIQFETNVVFSLSEVCAALALTGLVVWPTTTITDRSFQPEEYNCNMGDKRIGRSLVRVSFWTERLVNASSYPLWSDYWAKSKYHCARHSPTRLVRIVSTISTRRRRCIIIIINIKSTTTTTIITLGARHKTRLPVAAAVTSFPCYTHCVRRRHG